MTSEDRSTCQRAAPAQTFASFYSTHRDEIGRSLAMTFGDAGLGFDAVDEAMARAYARWDDIAEGANPAGWVFRAGLNWGRSWLRSRRRAGMKAPLVSADERINPVDVDVDLESALAELSDDHRAVVVLRYYLDWSVDMSAEALGVRPGTVKSRLSRALDLLADRLATDTVQEIT